MTRVIRAAAVTAAFVLCVTFCAAKSGGQTAPPSAPAMTAAKSAPMRATHARMADGSRLSIYSALLGNLAVAGVKFAAFAVGGSSAMLTEAIHSLVDSVDEVLLLIGQVRGAKPGDATHPLGYGMETYFWSFIVALMVFLLGGVLSIYEGVRHILKPEPVISPWISLGDSRDTLRVTYSANPPHVTSPSPFFASPRSPLSTK